MVFERIEQLKRQYTDKYVCVDDSRPELQRFRGMTGTVKTVNMSGRALVEFDENNNIGWFDIDLDFLRVIDAPLPKPEAKARPKEGAKPAKEAAAKPAAGKPAAAKPAAASSAPGKTSVADVLAAARSGAKSGATAPPAAASGTSAPAGGKMSVQDVLAAARGKAPSGAAPATPAPTAPAAGAKGGKMSVQDVLAAARGNVAAAVSAAAPAVSSVPGDATPVDAKRASIAEQLAAARKKDLSAHPNSTETKSETTGATKALGKDVSKMSVAEMLAAARAEKTSAPPTAKAGGSESSRPTPTAAQPVPSSAAPAEASTGSKRHLHSSVDDMIAYCRATDARG